MFYSIRHSRGETLVSVLVGIAILSVVLFGIANLLSSSASLEQDVSGQLRLSLLEQNATTLIRQTNTKLVAEKEVFYLYKNPTTRTIEVFTGSTNVAYAYINARGESVTNTGSTQESLYYRNFIVDQSDTTLRSGSQVIKGTVRELIRK